MILVVMGKGGARDFIGSGEIATITAATSHGEGINSELHNCASTHFSVSSLLIESAKKTHLDELKGTLTGAACAPPFF